MIRRNLRERGLVRLALWGRACIDGDLAAGGNARGCAFIGTKPGRLHGVADADADIAPFTSRRSLPSLKRTIAGRIKRALLTGRIIAAVIGHRAPVAKDDADLV